MEFHKLILSLIILLITSLIVRLFLNRKIRTAKLIRWWRLISDKFHDHQHLKIPEFNDNLQENYLFRRVFLYINSLESLEDSDFTNLFSGSSPNDVVLRLNDNQTVEDTFLGARLRWRFCVEDEIESSSSLNSRLKSRFFELRIRKRDKRRVLRPYLSHIHAVSDEIELNNRQTRLFTCGGGDGRWRSVPLTHPATMETIAMDAEVKNRINLDIETFLKSKQYYHRVGRVWRRSYLLYGPSGTGKSSFVAALAKSLNYDVYSLDYTKLSEKSDLKSVMLQTTPKSVILIEDFDKYITYTSTSSTPLTTILNFMDGILNSCCDERVMVFTTTTKDDIDPAILRPGRVDVHIHFPNCDYNNFKTLANNYLGLKDHKLFPQVEETMSFCGPTLSPAEMSELMMVNRSSPTRAIKSVISAMQASSALVVVGGNDSCRATPKNTVKTGRVTVDGPGEPGDGGGVGLKEGVKEIKKLYGLLRRKSSVRVCDSFELST
ncbi:hypothetical protein RND81_01G207000 [Saponaria officinalis]|uniref:AAA+ ATPase domain-containing protein n=1 Tax=Saponaria officinalis TaxID=3572 RepID=A0AAW1N8V8_SAPOF